MNSVLLSTGIAVVLALFTALLGPYFIDWNAYRPVFEIHLSEAVGRPVHIGGDLGVRILPMPLITANDVSIQADAREGGIPLLAAPRFRASVALSPLLSGEVRVNEVVVEEPVIQIFWGGDGRVELPGLSSTNQGLPLDRVSLETFELRSGSIVIRDAQFSAIKTLTGFNLTGEAGSLTGPFRAEGGIILDGDLYAFRLATGRLQDDGAIKTKLVVQPASNSFELALDGFLSAPDNKPTFAGAARLQHAAPPLDTAIPAEFQARVRTPWRLNAQLRATPLEIDMADLALGIGPEDRAVQFSGSARAQLQPELAIQAALSARQIDLDRALGGSPGETAAVGEVSGLLLDAVRNFSQLPFPVDLKLDADAALINGGLAEQLSLDVRLKESRLALRDFSLRLPGKTLLSGQADYRFTDAGPHLTGQLHAQTRQAAVLADWLGGHDLRFGPFAAQPGAAAIVLDGALNLAPDRFALDGLKVVLDDSRIAGSIAYVPGSPGMPGLVDLNLTADSLALDRYVRIGDSDRSDAAGKATAPPDLRLRLNAGALKLGGVGARSLLADLTFSNGALDIASLSLSDLDGTSLSAQGHIDDLFGQADGAVTALLNSPDLSGVTRLASELDLLPSNLDGLAARAKALSPAALDIRIKAERTDTGTEAEAKIVGTLGDTVADLSGTFSGKLADPLAGTVEARLEGNSGDGEQMLLQLGLLKQAGTGSGRRFGRVAATLNGSPARGARLEARADLVGVAAQTAGTLTLESDRPVAFDGTVKLETADARRALTLADAPGGLGVDPLSAAMTADLKRRDGAWRLDRIKGHAGAATFAGTLGVAMKAATAHVDGSLSLDTLDLPWLFSAFLGEDSGRGGSGTAWPQAAFDLRRTHAADGAVAIKAERLTLPGGLVASGASLELTLAPGTLALDGMQAGLFGGRLSVDMLLAERATGAALTGRVALKDAQLDRIVWTPRGTPVATGTLSMAAQVSGEGRSWQGLMSSLGGDGTFLARDGVLRGIDADAFASIVRAADAGLDLSDTAVLRAFRGYLDAGELTYGRFEGVLALNDGLVSGRNLLLETAEAHLMVNSRVDLAALKLNSEWTMTPVKADKDGKVPTATLNFSGPVANPQRRLDVSALTGYLTVRRLEQDVKRLEAAQADALERERLDRELINLTQEHMRRAREAREARERRAREQREAEAREQQRIEAERHEAERLQAEKLEAERRAAEAAAAARREAERRVQEEAERQAAERAAQEQARREDAASREADRRRQDEAERRKAEESAREEVRRAPAPDPPARAAAPGGPGSADAAADRARARTLQELVEEALRQGRSGAAGVPGALQLNAPLAKPLPPAQELAPPPGSGFGVPATGLQGLAPPQPPRASPPPAQPDPGSNVKLPYDPLGSSR